MQKQFGKRTWKDHIGRDTKKGKFQKDEIKKIQQKIQEVSQQQDLTIEELYNLLVTPSKDFKPKIWTEIAECLPERSVKSIKNFCQRKFNPMNYQGKWTEDEIEELKIQISNIGPSWVQLSKILNRTPENVRDKWNEIGGPQNKNRNKQWTIEECIKLVRIIEQFSNEQIKEKVNQKLNELKQYDQNSKSQKSLLNYCVRETFLNMQTKQKYNQMKFNWNKISKDLNHKSSIDTKNKWNMIFNYKYYISKKEKRNILKLLNQMKKQNVPRAKDKMNQQMLKIKIYQQNSKRKCHFVKI